MGLLDFLGGGDPNAINQTYGVPQGMVDRSNYDALTNMGALLFAAGQRLTPEQRAAYLAQMPNAIRSRDTSLYNQSQTRLMGQRAQEEEMQARKAAQQEAAMNDFLGNKDKLNALGIKNVDALLELPVGLRQQAIQKQLTTDPRANELADINLQQERAKLSALQSPKTAEYQTNTDELGNIWQTNTTTGQKQLLKGGEKPGNEKMTQDQANAALFSDRMDKSNKIISDPNVYKFGMGVAGTMNRANSAIPVIGNAFVDKEYQKYDQAKRDFLNATLRRESGAAIGKDEFSNADLQYFPQVGDSEEVIAQKEANRRTAIAGIRNAASPQFKRDNPLEAKQPQQSKAITPDVAAKAREAINKGANPAAVRQHLIDQGYDAAGL